MNCRKLRSKYERKLNYEQNEWSAVFVPLKLPEILLYLPEEGNFGRKIYFRYWCDFAKELFFKEKKYLPFEEFITLIIFNIFLPFLF